MVGHEAPMAQISSAVVALSHTGIGIDDQT
jgi:hypothetical protein